MGAASSSLLPVSPRTVSSECLCLGLKRAARVVARRYDEALRPLDLNNGQFSILTTVAGMEGAGIQALAEHLAMDRTTLTAALKPLERRGLIDVLVSDSDARGRIAQITPAGRALLSQAMPVWQSMQKQLTADVGRSLAAELRGHLSRIA